MNVSFRITNIMPIFATVFAAFVVLAAWLTLDGRVLVVGLLVAWLMSKMRISGMISRRRRRR